MCGQIRPSLKRQNTKTLFVLNKTNSLIADIRELFLANFAKHFSSARNQSCNEKTATFELVNTTQPSVQLKNGIYTSFRVFSQLRY